jgi:hypothetical protein
MKQHGARESRLPREGHEGGVGRVTDCLPGAVAFVNGGARGERSAPHNLAQHVVSVWLRSTTVYPELAARLEARTGHRDPATASDIAPAVSVPVLSAHTTVTEPS